MKRIEEIIARLKEKLNFTRDIQLTKYMNLASGTIGNWKKRGKIPYEEIFSICEKKNLNIEYIFYGIKEENTINYKEEILKSIEKFENKDLEYIYHIVKSKELKNK